MCRVKMKTMQARMRPSDLKSLRVYRSLRRYHFVYGTPVATGALGPRFAPPATAVKGSGEGSAASAKSAKSMACGSAGRRGQHRSSRWDGECWGHTGVCTGHGGRGGLAAPEEVLEKVGHGRGVARRGVRLRGRSGRACEAVEAKDAKILRASEACVRPIRQLLGRLGARLAGELGRSQCCAWALGQPLPAPASLLCRPHPRRPAVPQQGPRQPATGLHLLSHVGPDRPKPAGHCPPLVSLSCCPANDGRRQDEPSFFTLSHHKRVVPTPACDAGLVAPRCQHLGILRYKLVPIQAIQDCSLCTSTICLGKRLSEHTANGLCASLNTSAWDCHWASAIRT